MWTWDSGKAAANLQKHAVTFDLAERALGDPLAISVPDPHPDEERWRTIGSPDIGGRIVLYVVHTDDGHSGRIISARRATARERRDYEER